MGQDTKAGQSNYSGTYVYAAPDPQSPFIPAPIPTSGREFPIITLYAVVNPDEPFVPAPWPPNPLPAPWPPNPLPAPWPPNPLPEPLLPTITVQVPVPDPRTAEELGRLRKDVRKLGRTLDDMKKLVEEFLSKGKTR